MTTTDTEVNPKSAFQDDLSELYGTILRKDNPKYSDNWYHKLNSLAWRVTGDVRNDFYVISNTAKNANIDLLKLTLRLMFRRVENTESWRFSK